MSAFHFSSGVRRLGLLTLVVLLLAVTSGVSAQVDTYQFDTTDQQERFRRLSNELRCPMCQNTNLSGSTGGVAEDLRREVYRMIMEGMTDQEIEQFMFERYGDFIFYRPRFRTDTLLLWLGPIFFLMIGAFVAWSIWRRAERETPARDSLDAREQKRLAELLERDN